MLDKIEILVVILLLLITFYVVILLGSRRSNKKNQPPEIVRYMFGVKVLILLIGIVSLILWFLA